MNAIATSPKQDTFVQNNINIILSSKMGCKLKVYE